MPSNFRLCDSPSSRVSFSPRQPLPPSTYAKDLSSLPSYSRRTSTSTSNVSSRSRSSSDDSDFSVPSYMTSGVILLQPPAPLNNNLKPLDIKIKFPKYETVEYDEGDDWCVDFSELGWREYLLKGGKRELVWFGDEDKGTSNLGGGMSEGATWADGGLDGAMEVVQSAISTDHVEGGGVGLQKESQPVATATVLHPVANFTDIDTDDEDDNDGVVLIPHDEGEAADLEPFPDFNQEIADYALTVQTCKSPQPGTSPRRRSCAVHHAHAYSEIAAYLENMKNSFAPKSAYRQNKFEREKQLARFWDEDVAVEDEVTEVGAGCGRVEFGRFGVYD